MCFASDDFAAKVSWLKKKLRVRMNGETSSQMTKRQLGYAVNYGASLEHIKQLAAQCQFTPDECRKLWRLDIREAMLIAAILFPEPTAAEMTDWAELVRTPDMAEQASFFLFARVDGFDRFATALLTRNQGYDFAIACFTAGRMLLNGRPVDGETTERILALAQQRTTLSIADYRALSLFVRQLIRHHLATHSVDALVAALRSRADEPSHRLLYDIDTEKLCL